MTSRLRETPAGWRCVWHDPDRAKEAAAMRKAGGSNNGARHRKTVEADQVPLPLETMESCVEWCAWAATAVATGKIDARTAREILGAIREFRTSREKASLEGELRELRALVKELKKRGAA